MIGVSKTLLGKVKLAEARAAEREEFRQVLIRSKVLAEMSAAEKDCLHRFFDDTDGRSTEERQELLADMDPSWTLPRTLEHIRELYAKYDTDKHTLSGKEG